jgi:hypothetical protein
VAFFQPSQQLADESECTSEGMVCLSNLSALWLFGNEWGTNWEAGVVLTIEFQAHDFFQEQPVKGADVYFLRQILHD